ncbi:YsnF/AvaK domain-containing protein [Geodermatophilus sabuli]|uniref:YsnF/AvaK domain-containing protein n=1 Tax=Geodermatophilus sabuli TaxID=1564158 RepID=A0A7K3W8E3_9ACTN|nr:PRC and DUF2382 domain-containing protein [Geodermatophilus sabuli]NEK60137.1 YsnF/AvaK domain-containing protein [Geodermatophilus sabuli]
MLDQRELSAAIGSTAYGPDGEKIGTVEHFFTDDRTGAPTWAAVSTGLFGTRHSVVPAGEATFADGALRLPVTKEAVRSAPAVSDEHLDPEDEAALRRHYGLDTGVGPAAPAAAASQGTADAEIRDDGARFGDPRPAGDTDTVEVSAAGTPGTTAAAAAVPARPADGGMVRSEEQLRVGTERVATTRARLVKYVVTEEVTITVPIRREEVRLEEVPLDAPDAGPGESLTTTGSATDTPVGTPGTGTPGTGTPVGGVAGAGLPEEIVLHAERPVVSVEVVPVERVRLRTDVVTGQEQITEQVQREQIVVDEDRRGQR